MEPRGMRTAHPLGLHVDWQFTGRSMEPTARFMEPRGVPTAQPLDEQFTGRFMQPSA